MGYVEECVLCGIVSSLWKDVESLEDSRLCGRVWVVWNRMGYVQ